MPLDASADLSTLHSWCLQSLCAPAGDTTQQDMTQMATLKQGIMNSACMANNIDITNELLFDPQYENCLPDSG
jgi:hypothetical protein